MVPIVIPRACGCSPWDNAIPMASKVTAIAGNIRKILTEALNSPSSAGLLGRVDKTLHLSGDWAPPGPLRNSAVR